LKLMPFVVMTLALLFGATAVIVFHTPGKPKAKPRVEADGSVPDDDAPSKRVPVYSMQTPKPPPDEAMQPSTSPAGVDARWAKLNKEGIQALEAGQDDKAVYCFEQCYKAVPTEKIFAGNLAEALAQLGSSEYDRGGAEDRKHALEHMARAAELLPDRADIQRRLQQMQQLSKSEEGLWTEISEHFELSYDGSRDDITWRTTEITTPLETAYQQYGELFGFYPVEAGSAGSAGSADGRGEKGRGRIRVILYGKQGFHEATGIGHWAGGLYDGALRLPLENLGREKEQLVRVLRHELAHAFVHELGGRDVPAWLNEGLAQRLESESMAVAQSNLEGARRRLHGKELIPLADLELSLSTLKTDERITQGYAEALAFVAFLEKSYGERVLYQMVAACKKPGAPGAPAAIGRELKDRAGVTLGTAFEDFGQGL
jgi:tetratricopeptide (TPR) repeat protein